MMLKNTNYHPKPVGDRDERWEMYLREYNTTDGSNFKQRIRNEKREAQSQILWPLRYLSMEWSDDGVSHCIHSLFDCLGALLGSGSQYKKLKMESVIWKLKRHKPA